MNTTSLVTKGALPRAHVVRGEDVTVEPLYPARRLMRSVQFDAEAHEREAARLLREARERAEDVLAAGHGQARSLAETARRRAARLYVHARRRARRRAAGEVAERLRDLEREMTEHRARLAHDVQETAFRFARAILDVEFQVRPERIVDLVRSALQRARAQRRIVVRVAARHHALVAQAISTLHELTLGSELHVTADPTLRSDSVLLETEAGTYDASLTVQLDQLAEYLRDDEGEP